MAKKSADGLGLEWNAYELRQRIAVLSEERDAWEKEASSLTGELHDSARQCETARVFARRLWKWANDAALRETAYDTEDQEQTEWLALGRIAAALPWLEETS